MNGGGSVNVAQALVEIEEGRSVVEYRMELSSDGR